MPGYKVEIVYAARQNIRQRQCFDPPAPIGTQRLRMAAGQRQFNAVEQEESRDRNKGQPLWDEHKRVLSAELVQSGYGVGDYMDKHHQQTKQDVQPGQLGPPGSGHYSTSIGTQKPLGPKGFGTRTVLERFLGLKLI